MMGTKILIKGLGRNLARMKRISRGLKDLTPFLKQAGLLVIESIQRNIEEGGRPEKWPLPSPVTVLLRAKSRKTARHKAKDFNSKGGIGSYVESAETLRDKGLLLASIGHPARGGIFLQDDRSIEVGTTLSYAKPLNDGFTTSGMIKGKKVPARRFMMLQAEDGARLVSLGKGWAKKVVTEA